VPLPPLEVDPDRAPPDLESGLQRIREELDVPGPHGTAALAEAEEAAERVLAGLDGDVASGRRVDATHVELVTIDPPGSKDLDQALHIARRAGGGWVVRYAIADVGAFVAVGGPLDDEVNERGLTYYLPGSRAPLHPAVLGEGAASLLPDELRPALMWEIQLDGAGSVAGSDLRRAVVRSRRKLTYEEAQADLDGGTAPESLALLAEVGRARQEAEVARGGVSLDLPTQRVVLEDGRCQLELEQVVPAMGWNAQISLLTGIVAAGAMVDAGVGLLRTLPPPDPRVVKRVARAAAALGVPWLPASSYAESVRALDGSDPDQAALLDLAAGGLRGAGYLPLLPGQPLPEDEADLRHAAVASVYAHVTAPLRRLCDRHANEVLVALYAGEEPPGPVVDQLVDLPRTMARAGGRAASASRAAIDLVEALLLEPRVGEVVQATVVSSDERGSTVVITSPAAQLDVEAPDLPLGETVPMVIAAADPLTRTVRLEPAGTAGRSST